MTSSSRAKSASKFSGSNLSIGCISLGTLDAALALDRFHIEFMRVHENALDGAPIDTNLGVSPVDAS